MEEKACSCWNDFIVFIQKPSCEAWEENSLTTNPISCPDPRVDTKQSISQLFNSDFIALTFTFVEQSFHFKVITVISSVCSNDHLKYKKIRNIWKNNPYVHFLMILTIERGVSKSYLRGISIPIKKTQILQKKPIIKKNYFWANLIIKISLFEANFKSILGLSHASLFLLI